MKEKINMFLISVASICLFLLAGCKGQSSTNETDAADETDIVDKKEKPIFTGVLYSDDTGDLRNSNGERVCAIKVYSRSDPMSLHFSSDIDWNGIELDDIYLKNGNVYIEYPFSSRIDEYTPIATYNMSSRGSEMSFEFFASVSTEKIRKVSLEKKREREAREKERERERLEREKNTWSGAESLEELKTKLNGTTWHSQPNSDYGGILYKFVFDNGTIKRYSARVRDGKWGDDVVYFSSYKIEQRRDTGGNNFIQISFGDGSDIEHAYQQIAFAKKCTIVAWFIEGNHAGMLTFGDYKWSDSL